MRRRTRLLALVCGGLGCIVADAFLIEPHWIKIDRFSLGGRSSLRIVHISDIHYKGERSYLARIVADVNRLAPDVVCFTGDIVEDARYLDEAIEALGKIDAPMYGVPGNHEYWSGASFARIGDCFRGTGGEWLVDRYAVASKGRLLIAGRSGTEIDVRRSAADLAMPGRGMGSNPVHNSLPASPAVRDLFGAPAVEDWSTTSNAPGAKRILLTHYPILVESIQGPPYDLIPAGHAHGGQVRLPFVGSLIVPFGVNGYQKGMYSTRAGPLHVSSGLGTFLLPVRFNCRPEITLIEL